MRPGSGEKALAGRRTGQRLPWHAWAGGVLVAVFWPLNWGLSGLRTHWAFFPLWLGYCLAVDGLAVRLRGTSLASRDARRYVALFLVSVPLWWLFEAVNQRTHNWHYEGADELGDVEYALLASLSFSTVVPAVLGTAECVAALPWVRRCRNGPRIGGGWHLSPALLGAGVVMLGLLLAWPRLFYPFTWCFPFCFVEALNIRLGLPSLTGRLRAGDWRPVAALFCGVLVCAFFWEMWNYLSYPRWVYATPGVGFPYVFEMPLLGYLGYLPFALGVHAVSQLALGLVGTGDPGYVTRGLVGAERR